MGVEPARERHSINQGWKFYKYETSNDADHLIYDTRPDIIESTDERPADAMPTEAQAIDTTQESLKAWILPTGNSFIKDPGKHYVRTDIFELDSVGNKSDEIVARLDPLKN